MNNHNLLQTTARGFAVRDRILVHLATFGLYETDHWAPTQVSQKGIARAVGISPKHIPQYVRPMINEGLVKESSSYIQGGRQHQKVYFLTSKGREAAGWMHDNTHDTQRSKQTNRASENTAWASTKIPAASLKKRGR
jgi:predicted transcriptional regulator